MQTVNVADVNNVITSLPDDVYEGRGHATTQSAPVIFGSFQRLCIKGNACGALAGMEEPNLQ